MHFSLSSQVFTRLQKLLVCLSHKRTVAYMDRLGENHDRAVLEWRQSVLEQKSLPLQVVITLLTTNSYCLAMTCNLLNL